MASRGGHYPGRVADRYSYSTVAPTLSFWPRGIPRRNACHINIHFSVVVVVSYRTDTVQRPKPLTLTTTTDYPIMLKPDRWKRRCTQRYPSRCTASRSAARIDQPCEGLSHGFHRAKYRRGSLEVQSPRRGQNCLLNRRGRIPASSGFLLLTPAPSVIVGHSERATLFWDRRNGEPNASGHFGGWRLMCVGETLPREQSRGSVSSINGGLTVDSHLSRPYHRRLRAFAIGTGRTATPNNSEIHALSVAFSRRAHCEGVEASVTLRWFGKADTSRVMVRRHRGPRRRRVFEGDSFAKIVNYKGIVLRS